MAAQVPKDTDICPVDFYVKSRVVKDCVNLVRQKRQKIISLNKFQSLTKVYPNQEDKSKVISDVVNELRELFYRLAPLKNKMAVSSMNFQKMGNASIFKSKKFTKMDIGICFQKFTIEKSVSFVQFCDLMISFHQKIAQEIDFHEFIHEC